MSEHEKAKDGVDIPIELDNLDAEWLRQPVLYGRYSRRHARAKRDVALAKLERDQTLARLSAKVRSNFEKYNLERKAGAASVEAVVNMMPEALVAEKAYIKAQYAEDMLFAAVMTLNKRNDALENLVRLQGAEYFSGPVAPRDARAVMSTAKAIEGRAKMAREKLRDVAKGQVKK